MPDFHISLEAEEPLANFEIGVPGPPGPTGPAGPNSVTSATTSDGTAELEVLTLSAVEGISALRGAEGSHAIYADGGNGTAINATSLDGDAVTITSDNATALTVTSNTGNYIAVFRDALSNGINIENPRGWLTWVYEPGEIYLGRLKTADITDDREWTLPDRSGNVALTEDYTDGTATIDILNATVQGTLTASHIHGNLAGSVYAHIRAGENLAKGDPVYVSGSHGSGETLIPVVSKADASNAAKMPAVGVMDAAVTVNNNGHMVITGTITELNTNAYPVNTVLYVATGGGWTSTPPAANSQAVAIVERSNNNNGAVIVKVNGLGSSGGNGAADANKLVRYSSTGGASLTGGTLTDMTYAGTAAFTSTTRPTSAGTGTPEATSLITRADGDARYGGEIIVSRLTQDGAAIQSQTILQDTGCSVSLAVGVWEILAQTHVTNANAAAQGKMQASLSGGTFIADYGYVTWAHGNTGVPSHDNLNWLTALRVFGNGARPYARYEGLVVVTSGTTTLKTQYAQNVSTAADTIVRQNTFIIARKIA